MLTKVFIIGSHLWTGSTKKELLSIMYMASQLNQIFFSPLSNQKRSKGKLAYLAVDIFPLISYVTG